MAGTAVGVREAVLSNDGDSTNAASSGRQAGAARTNIADYDLLVTNAQNPWDAAFTPDGDLLFTEKCQGLSIRTKDGAESKIFNPSDFVCQGQSGMHGVAVDPNFGVAGDPNEFDVYVFFGSDERSEAQPSRPRTNRVARLTLDRNDITRPVVAREDIVTDIYFKYESNGAGGAGSHSGGRIGFGPKGGAYEDTLFITSGDNHNGTLPQDNWAMGSKILAVDRNGRADPRNVMSAPQGDSRVFFYGVRNAQGLAFRNDGSDQVYIAEHGPNHSDEVTLLTNGGNGGWDPKDRPQLNCPSGYCGYAGNVNTMPMTDTTRFPDAQPPVWNYNGVSAGMGPCAFLDGPQWGDYDGALVVSVMGGLLGAGDRNLNLLKLDAAGNMLSAEPSTGIPRTRYRAIEQAPSGNLLALTDAGDIFEITPNDLLP